MSRSYFWTRLMVQRGLGVTLAAALSDWPRTNLRSLIRAVVRASWRLAAAPLMAERADWHGLNLALVTIRVGRQATSGPRRHGLGIRGTRRQRSYGLTRRSPRRTIGRTICVSGYTTRIRPPESYTEALKSEDPPVRLRRPKAVRLRGGSPDPARGRRLTEFGQEPLARTA